MSAPSPHAQPLPDTRDRLLAAAEQIVLREGPHQLSIRRIATVSKLNSALISYHFGGLDPLLAELVQRNVDAICDWRAELIAAASRESDGERRLYAQVMAYMDPLWRTPALWNHGAARAVARELMPRLDRARLVPSVQRINASVEASAQALAAELPSIAMDRIRMRLRLLAGAADMLRLPLDSMGLYPVGQHRAAPNPELLHNELIQLSLGALRAP